MNFTDKYRPASWDDFIGQDNVIKEISGYIENRRESNVALVGPSGCGKTSAALLLGELVSVEPGLNMHFLPADQCSLENVIKYLNESKLYGPMPAANKDTRKPRRVLILDDFHLFNSKAREKLRNAFEAIWWDRMVIVTCETLRGWSAAMRSRFRILNFNKISHDDAQRYVSKVWKAEGKNGLAPTMSELGIFPEKGHYNLRDALLNGLECFIDRGCVSMNSKVDEEKCSPSRKAARLVLHVLSEKEGRKLSPTEAYDMLTADKELLAYVRSSSSELTNYQLPTGGKPRDSFAKYCRS